MQLIFENEHFAVVDKPAGWLSVPSRMGSADQRPCVGPALSVQLGCRLWPVHRLDEEVTGLLLFAKNADAHRAANSWFEGHSVEKTYEAFAELKQPLTESTPPASYRWESRILRGKKRAYASPHGKDAVTTATLHGTAPWHGTSVTTWTLHPHTGRPHQLRFEMYQHGHPIVGDTLYGATVPFVGGAIALRCVRLAFKQPEATATFGLPAVLATTSCAAWAASASSPLEEHGPP